MEMAAVHSQRAGHPDPFMPAAGYILWRRRHEIILPDRHQQRGWTHAGLVYDLDPGTSEDSPDTLFVLPQLSVMETFPLCQVINNPICDHAASHQFCSGLRAMIQLSPGLTCANTKS